MASHGCRGCGSHLFKDGVCTECERPKRKPKKPKSPTPASAPVSTKEAAEHARRLLAALDAAPVQRPMRNPTKNAALSAAAHAKSILEAMGDDALAFARGEQTLRFQRRASDSGLPVGDPGAFWDEVVAVLERDKAQRQKAAWDAIAEQQRKVVAAMRSRREPSRAFTAMWQEHVAREQKRSEEQIAHQIQIGTREQRRRLPQVRDRSEKKPDTAVLEAHQYYDHIVVAFSGGKDSLACVLHLLDVGVPKEKIELWHYCVDGEPGKSQRFFDWPITEDYCRAVAEALGIKLLFRWREGGFERELLKHNARSAPVGFELLDGTVSYAGGLKGDITTQGKFPRQGTIVGGRWCSGILKVDVARLTLNNDPRFEGKRTLIMMGERAEESGPRARYPDVERDSTDSGKKSVTTWHPILEWPEAEVWEIIARYKVRPHPAYYVGFSRLSCMPCIFGNDDQWATVNTFDPKLIKKIAAYEHGFYVSPQSPGTIHPKYDVAQRAGRGISYLAEEMSHEERDFAFANADLAKDEHYPRELTIVKNKWVLPRGAGRHSGGPT